MFSTYSLRPQPSPGLRSLSQIEKHTVVAQIWPNSALTLPTFDEEAYTWFFAYIEHSIQPLEQYGKRFSVKTLREIIDLIQYVSNSSSQPLSSVIRTMAERHPNFDEASIQRSLELSVRIWLTLNVSTSSLAMGPTMPFEKPLQWSSDTALDSLIQSRFRRLQVSRQDRAPRRIEGSFTAAYLVDVCGMTLNWTDSLTDHLRIDPKRQTLTVYRHKICLLNHLRSGKECPIPKTILAEALDTLVFLFPFGDVSTRQLLIREKDYAFYRLGNCSRDPEPDLGSFVYWRDELQDLVDAFARPRTWRQLATDRRNLMEWAAFWVTFMVGILTLVSIPCNIIQATYSAKSYYATLAQGREGS